MRAECRMKRREIRTLFWSRLAQGGRGQKRKSDALWSSLAPDLIEKRVYLKTYLFKNVLV